MWLQRVAGSPEAKPDPQQIVQRGKDRRASLLQKSGSRVSNIFASAPQVGPTGQTYHKKGFILVEATIKLCF